VRVRVGLVLFALPMLLGSAGVPRADCPQTPAQIVMDLVNAERAKQGLSPLQVNLRLHEAALAHAKDLASGPESGHVGSDGSDPAQRADAAGYEWIRIGENVAAGQTLESEVVRAWMDSKAHRDNILGRQFREAAVGFEPDTASRWGTYWVMIFGTRDDRDVSGDAECNP